MSVVNTVEIVSAYPVGDPSYITKLWPGDSDQVGLWVYTPDSGIGENLPTRVLRFNMLTYAAEVWLSPGDLPSGKGSLCFSHDFATLYFISFNNQNLYAIDVATKAVTTIGDLGANYSSFKRLPTAGQFLLASDIRRNFDRLDMPGFVVTLDIVTAGAFACTPDVTAAGEVYRGWLKDGPGGTGPIYHTISGQLASTLIDAGLIVGGTDPTLGPVKQAFFHSNAVAATPDAVYVSYDNNLYAIYGGNIVLVGNPGGSFIIGKSLQNNVLAIYANQTVYFWHHT